MVQAHSSAQMFKYKKRKMARIKKYKLNNVSGDMTSIISYVIKAMRECKCSKEQIEDYKEKVKNNNFYSLLIVSKDQLEKLNAEIENQYYV